MIYLLLAMEKRVESTRRKGATSMPQRVSFCPLFLHPHNLAVANLRQIAAHDLLRPGERLPRAARPDLFPQHLDSLAIARPQLDRQAADLTVLYLIAIVLVAARHLALGRHGGA